MADPDNADARSTRGTFLGQEGKLDEALADFEHALRINPRHTNAYQNREYTLQQLGRPDRQLTDLWLSAGLIEKPHLHTLRRAIRGMRSGIAGLIAKKLYN